MILCLLMLGRVVTSNPVPDAQGLMVVVPCCLVRYLATLETKPFDGTMKVDPE